MSKVDKIKEQRKTKRIAEIKEQIAFNERDARTLRKNGKTDWPCRREIIKLKNELVRLET